MDMTTQFCSFEHFSDNAVCHLCKLAAHWPFICPNLIQLVLEVLWLLKVLTKKLTFGLPVRLQIIQDTFLYLGYRARVEVKVAEATSMSACIVWALNFEFHHLESSFLVCRCIFWKSNSFAYQGHRVKVSVTGIKKEICVWYPVCSGVAFSWNSILLIIIPLWLSSVLIWRLCYSTEHTKD